MPPAQPAMDVVARKSAPAAEVVHGTTQSSAPARSMPPAPAQPAAPPQTSPVPRPHADTAHSVPDTAPPSQSNPAANAAKISTPQGQGPTSSTPPSAPAGVQPAHPALEVRPMPASAEPMSSHESTDAKSPANATSHPASAPEAAGESAPQPAASNTKNQHQLPTGAIVLTLLVMAVLMAVAIMAYKHPR